MSNVIAFPKYKRETPPMSLEELFDKVRNTRQEHIEFILDEILPSLIFYINTEGFDITSDKCEKEMIFFVESFRSLLYKAARLEHKFHDLAEEVIEVEEIQ